MKLELLLQNLFSFFFIRIVDVVAIYRKYCFIFIAISQVHIKIEFTESAINKQ